MMSACAHTPPMGTVVSAQPVVPGCSEGVFQALGVSGDLLFSAEELRVLLGPRQLLPQGLAPQYWRS